MKVNIEQELRQMSIITPSRAFQEDAKRRLFSKIQKQESFWLIRVLQNIFKPLPSSEFAENALVRLMQRIEKPRIQVQESILSFIREFLFSHKYVSLVLTGVFICVFVINIPQTEANAKTELLVDFGTVEVKSLGENWGKVDARTILKIGDQVRTGNASQAEIFFPNSSVVRIASNTSVNVAQFLQGENQNDLVILKLQEGRLWSSIISKKQDFFVETRQSRVSTHFGVFDIQADTQTRIQSIQNTVNIEPRILTGSGEILLSAGFATTVSDAESPVTTKISEDTWSKENQQKDKVLRAAIFAKEQKELKVMAGILPGNPLYEMKQVVTEFSSQTLQDIQSEFAASKVLMTAKENDLAIQQFHKAQVDLQALWSLPENQAQTQKDILAYLDEEKVFFSQMLPSNVLASLKPLFQDLFIAYANNPQQEKINQVAEKMLEVQNLIVQKPEDAKTLLVASLDSFSVQNQQIIDQSLQTNSKEDMTKLLSLQTKNLQMLQNIADNIEDKEAQDKAEAVRADLVNTIQNIVSKLAPEQKPAPSVNNNQANWFAGQIKIIVQKIETYESERGRVNTLHWVLENIDNKKENLGFLYALKDALPDNAKLPVSNKILKIRQQK